MRNSFRYGVWSRTWHHLQWPWTAHINPDFKVIVTPVGQYSTLNMSLTVGLQDRHIAYTVSQNTDRQWIGEVMSYYCITSPVQCVYLPKPNKSMYDVTAKVRNLPSKFWHAMLLHTGLIRYVRDRRTDCMANKCNAYCSLPYIGGIIIYTDYKGVCNFLN